ncbi:hypothetical protein [Halomicrococcus sp. SG-WS-1]|uniref:hypothetical protein n=1 Tax=Halomicrococcus sp. SG-WS-1 TaxID=3439057 RepID=UPI003F7978B7
MYCLEFSTSEFDPSRVLRLDTETYVEFVTLGDSDRGVFPQFWAYGPEREALASRLETVPEVLAVSKDAVHDDRVRYEVRWDDDWNRRLTYIARLIRESDATFLFGRADRTLWKFLLRSDSSSALADLYADCAVSPHRVEHRSPRQAHAFLTGRERTA